MESRRSARRPSPFGGPDYAGTVETDGLPSVVEMVTPSEFVTCEDTSNFVDWTLRSDLHSFRKLATTKTGRKKVEAWIDGGEFSPPQVTFSPLLAAAHLSTLDIFKFFESLDNGKTLRKEEIPDDFMLYAASGANFDVVQYLLAEKKASSTVKDAAGNGIMHYLMGVGNFWFRVMTMSSVSRLKLLSPKSQELAIKRVEVIENAVILNDQKRLSERLKMVDLLFAKGHTPFEKNNYDMSPVIISAIYSPPEVIQRVLEIDPEGTRSHIDDINTSGFTALHWASLRENTSEEIVSLLLKAGASVNILSHESLSPLAVACHRSNIEAALAIINSEKMTEETKVVSYQAAGAHPEVLMALNLHPFTPVPVNISADEVWRIVLDSYGAINDKTSLNEVKKMKPRVRNKYEPGVCALAHGGHHDGIKNVLDTFWAAGGHLYGHTRVDRYMYAGNENAALFVSSPQAVDCLIRVLSSGHKEVILHPAMDALVSTIYNKWVKRNAHIAGGVFLFMMVTFMTSSIMDGNFHSSSNTFTLAKCFAGICVAICAILLCIETREMILLGLCWSPTCAPRLRIPFPRYLKSPLNIFEFFLYSWIALSCIFTIFDVTSRARHRFQALGIFLVFIRLFIETQNFESLASLSDIVVQMMRVTFVFLVYVGVFLCANSCAFFILLSDDEVEGYGSLYDSSWSVFRTMLGDLVYDDIAEASAFEARIYYFLLIVIATILLLNLLIGWISNIYANLVESAEVTVKVRRARSTANYLRRGGIRRAQRLIHQVIGKHWEKPISHVSAVDRAEPEKVLAEKVDGAMKNICAMTSDIRSIKCEHTRLIAELETQREMFKIVIEKLDSMKS